MPLGTDLRTTLLWPDDAAEASAAMHVHREAGMMRSVVPVSSAVHADAALEMAVEARACTAITPFAAYRLRPFQWEGETREEEGSSSSSEDPRRAYQFCLQRWTFGHQAQRFLRSVGPRSAARSPRERERESSSSSSPPTTHGRVART